MVSFQDEHWTAAAAQVRLRRVAHELAHTIQQGHGSYRELRIAPDDAMELQARQASDAAFAAKRVTTRPGRDGRLARQGTSAGQPAPVAPPVAETEDPFKTT